MIVKDNIKFATNAIDKTQAKYKIIRHYSDINWELWVMDSENRWVRLGEFDYFSNALDSMKNIIRKNKSEVYLYNSDGLRVNNNA